MASEWRLGSTHAHTQVPHTHTGISSIRDLRRDGFRVTLIPKCCSSKHDTLKVTLNSSDHVQFAQIFLNTFTSCTRQGNREVHRDSPLCSWEPLCKSGAKPLFAQTGEQSSAAAVGKRQRGERWQGVSRLCEASPDFTVTVGVASYTSVPAGPKRLDWALLEFVYSRRAPRLEDIHFFPPKKFY